MRKTILAAIAMASVPLLFATSAGAQELRLFGGGHFSSSGQPLAEAFSEKTAIATSYTPGNTGAGGMARRMNAGEIIDVVVLNRDDMNMQVEAGLIKADSVVVFAQDFMGVAVPEGAPKPEISTAEELRETLLAAAAPGMQGRDPERPNRGRIMGIVLERLRIEDEVMSKAVIITSGTEPLLDGSADVVFWSYPELLGHEDIIDVVGSIPAEFGANLVLSVGIPTSNENDADARAFIQFLTSPDAEAVYRHHGLDARPTTDE